ncbi:hypothetical protein MRB53_030143 [Persea americana]|uniref:Uncharacterized protein n=1 Tax=Persea americana TaxID=3435 RepID=A0ACC2KKW5_PERAE|nr:hypothetical protein MRB53_030143 [Persea americana]
METATKIKSWSLERRKKFRETREREIWMEEDGQSSASFIEAGMPRLSRFRRDESEPSVWRWDLDADEITVLDAFLRCVRIIK